MKNQVNPIAWRAETSCTFFLSISCVFTTEESLIFPSPVLMLSHRVGQIKQLTQQCLEIAVPVGSSFALKAVVPQHQRILGQISYPAHETRPFAISHLGNVKKGKGSYL
jgi:hypothetical protein